MIACLLLYITFIRCDMQRGVKGITKVERGIFTEVDL